MSPPSLLLPVAKGPGLWALSSSQRWWHSCCSVKDLELALEDESVSAIESDVVFSGSRGEAVMAHPPVTESDLTFEAFMGMGVEALAVRHLKLDFKEERVLDECLKRVAKYVEKMKERRQGLWLNADILAGPGCASSKFDADVFIRKCLEAVPEGVLSLGWRVDLGVGGPYSAAQVDDMLDLLKRHALPNAQTRVVVTANFRLAIMDETHLLRVLDETPCELLLWTGFGEPSISQADLDYAIALFTANTDTSTDSSKKDFSLLGGEKNKQQETTQHHERRDISQDLSRKDRVGFDVSLASNAQVALAASTAFRIFRIYSFVKAASTNFARDFFLTTSRSQRHSWFLKEAQSASS